MATLVDLHNAVVSTMANIGLMTRPGGYGHNHWRNWNEHFAGKGCMLKYIVEPVDEDGCYGVRMVITGICGKLQARAHIGFYEERICSFDVAGDNINVHLRDLADRVDQMIVSN